MKNPIKAKKKPVIIEALRWDGTNLDAVESFTEGLAQMLTSGLHIATLEGVMKASIGDWIIKGVNEEFYPCKDDIFRKTYDMVGEPA